MSDNKKKLLQKFSYSFIANIIGLSISLILIIIIPKIIGVTDYGYWQIYMFYLTYIAFFHFGHQDGIYLKYGGMDYINLDKKLFVSQFWLLCIFELFISVCFLCYGLYFVQDTNRSWIFSMIGVNIIIVLPTQLLQFVLQLTNRIEEYSKSLILSRLSYGFAILLLVSLGIRDYKLLVVADIFGKIAGLILCVFYCKEIVIGKSVGIRLGLKEAYDNVKVGINLLTAYIAGLLVIGIVRYGIEHTWDVATFGKVSLAMNISSILLSFITAISIIIFPIIKNIHLENLPQIYTKMEKTLVIPLIGMMVIFYPIKIFLALWLPKYAASLVFMGLLFPICFYEGKMSMLINTYLKALRKEKLLLKINLVTLILSLLSTIITILLLKSITMTVLSITIILACRCMLSEIMLSKILKIGLMRNMILELFMMTIFILCSWFIGNILGLLIYLIAYFIYLFIKRADVIYIKNLALSILKKR